MTLTATVPIGPFSIAAAFAGRSGTSGLVGAGTSEKSAIFGFVRAGARAGVAVPKGQKVCLVLNQSIWAHFPPVPYELQRVP